MPNLPTLTVTQAQADRMIAAYGSVAAYKEWLKQSIIDFVLEYEENIYDESYRVERNSRRDKAKTDLTTGVV